MNATTSARIGSFGLGETVVPLGRGWSSPVGCSFEGAPAQDPFGTRSSGDARAVLWADALWTFDGTYLRTGPNTASAVAFATGTVTRETSLSSLLSRLDARQSGPDGNARRLYLYWSRRDLRAQRWSMRGGQPSPSGSDGRLEVVAWDFGYRHFVGFCWRAALEDAVCAHNLRDGQSRVDRTPKSVATSFRDSFRRERTTYTATRSALEVDLHSSAPTALKKSTK